MGLYVPFITLEIECISGFNLKALTDSSCQTISCHWALPIANCQLKIENSPMGCHYRICCTDSIFTAETAEYAEFLIISLFSAVFAFSAVNVRHLLTCPRH